MNPTAILAVCLATGVASALAAQQPAAVPPPTVLRVSEAWARASQPGRPMSAAYAVIENPGTTPIVLTGVTCDSIPVAQIHESYEENGMMRMRHVPELVVPAGGRVELRPGGYHVMLMQLPAPLAAGGIVRCDLLAGTRVLARFEAQVRAP